MCLPHLSHWHVLIRHQQRWGAVKGLSPQDSGWGVTATWKLLGTKLSKTCFPSTGGFYAWERGKQLFFLNKENKSFLFSIIYQQKSYFLPQLGLLPLYFSCSLKQEFPTPQLKYARTYTSNGTSIFAHATKMWEISVHSPEFNLAVKSSLCTGETKLSDAKSASRKQGERAHKPAACGTRGMSGGEAWEGGREWCHSREHVAGSRGVQDRGWELQLTRVGLGAQRCSTFTLTLRI